MIYYVPVMLKSVFWFVLKVQNYATDDPSWSQSMKCLRLFMAASLRHLEIFLMPGTGLGLGFLGMFACLWDIWHKSSSTGSITSVWLRNWRQICVILVYTRMFLEVQGSRKFHTGSVGVWFGIVGLDLFWFEEYIPVHLVSHWKRYSNSHYFL